MSLDTTSFPIPVARSVDALRSQVAAWRKQGQTIALVPTMGALHRGHLALVEMASREADRVVVSIFVNPTQFAPGEDFDAYPRTEGRDIEVLLPMGVDLVFGPSGSEMYAPDFSTGIEVGGVSEGLCAQSRPHFFGGVAVVVAKLLLQCLPDVAIFGEKDYQQLLVIKRMVRDLDIPVRVLGGVTVREEDGLAISSRNAYMSEEERQTAASLNRVLRALVVDVRNGKPAEQACQSGIEDLIKAGFDRVDYLEVRDGETLEPVSLLERPARVLVAAHIGKTRLIDNMAI